jgi:hypothetical protein
MLLVAPLIAIFMLSKEEVKKYEPQPVPPLVEKAYGEICMVKRTDISETIIISISKTQDEEGKTVVLLSVANGVYGKTVN